MMRQMLRTASCELKPDDGCLEVPRGIYWFGHAETVIMLVTKLGLFNESVRTHLGGGHHMRAADFQSRLRRLASRPPVSNLFRTAHIAPFAGNIVFLLHHRPRHSKLINW
ncbi:unnamed protein product [Dibothriocephalus latus]|uniref:Multiple inositol polyphosphate phosphatase 1 n=1 Tax=Dibothriocephalus latus TaxID=60516 RepID=A0A3P7MEZ2_DIBLA|nr:unnamed protein product [Dibothriocephalus latus]